MMYGLQNKENEKDRDSKGANKGALHKGPWIRIRCGSGIWIQRPLCLHTTSIRIRAVCCAAWQCMWSKCAKSACRVELTRDHIESGLGVRIQWIRFQCGEPQRESNYSKHMDLDLLSTINNFIFSLQIWHVFFFLRYAHLNRALPLACLCWCTTFLSLVSSTAMITGGKCMTSSIVFIFSIKFTQKLQTYCRCYSSKWSKLSLPFVC